MARSYELRRVEVITGVERRRSWPDDFKAKVIAESLAPGLVISQVARRHGLTPQQLFKWPVHIAPLKTDAVRPPVLKIIEDDLGLIDGEDVG